MSPAENPALSVRDVSIEYRAVDGWVRVVRNVSFDLPVGRTLALVGESGSGKSTTGLACMGLIPFTGGRIPTGRIIIDGVDLLGLRPRAARQIRGSRIGMVFQEPMTSMNPVFTVGNQIAESVRLHRDVSRHEALDQAVELLDRVGIPNPRRRAKAYPHELSGGMRQRAMIAMAVACKPRVLIADEPTTALDVTVQAQVLDLLKQMQSEMEMSILFITHDLSVVADVADDVIVMYAGSIVEHQTSTAFFAAPQHPYSEGLLRSTPQATERGAELHVIPGVPPPHPGTTDGCEFAPRCHYASDLCREVDPRATHLSAGGTVRCHHALTSTRVEVTP